MLGKMKLQKREREPHLKRSSGQQPPNLPQHALPYQRLHQSLGIVCSYLQYQQEKTPHGLVQARCWETILRTEIGYSLKTTWPLKTKNENVTGITSPKPTLKEEPKIL